LSVKKYSCGKKIIVLPLYQYNIFLASENINVSVLKRGIFSVNNDSKKQYYFSLKKIVHFFVRIPVDYEIGIHVYRRKEKQIRDEYNKIAFGSPVTYQFIMNLKISG